MGKNDLHKHTLLRDLLPSGTPIPLIYLEKPIIIDLFCGAGCAAEGYLSAGLAVIGVDIKKPSSYPGIFIQGDWLRNLSLLLPIASAIHASPPCQEYSRLKAFTKMTNSKLLVPVRQALASSNIAYVIENVTSAPLLNPITLSGTQFGLSCIKKRGFESNVLLMMPGKAAERGLSLPTIAGHSFGARLGRSIYGISRPLTRHELAEGIPPAYTAWLGWQLINHITA